MLISLRYAFAFIHNPKTGGTSITRRLSALTGVAPDVFGDLNVLPHTRAADLRELVGRDLYRRLFTFGFVRNPWDLVYSYYTYVRTLPTHWQHERIMAFGDFAAYLEACRRRFAEAGRQRDCPLPFSQTEQLCDDAGRPAVDFVGRFENLDADFAKVLRRIGVPPRFGALPHKNQTAHGDYRAAYVSSRMVDCVGEIYAADVRRFGYAFESGDPAAAGGASTGDSTRP